MSVVTYIRSHRRRKRRQTPVDRCGMSTLVGGVVAWSPPRSRAMALAEAASREGEHWTVKFFMSSGGSHGMHSLKEGGVGQSSTNGYVTPRIGAFERAPFKISEWL